MSFVVAFVHARTGNFIVGGFTLLATLSIIWDNRMDCKEATVGVSREIQSMKEEIQKEIQNVKEKVDWFGKRITVRVDDVNGNLIAMGGAITRPIQRQGVSARDPEGD